MLKTGASPTYEVAQPRLARGLKRRRPPPEPQRERRPWWRRPRLRSLVFLSALAVVTLFARVLAHFQTDWLWFEELGHDQAFWTMLAARWLATGLVGLGTTIFLLTNFWIVERTAPLHSQVKHRRLLLAGYLLVSVAMGLLVGRTIAVGGWQGILLWLNRQEFGVSDPLFGRDVGFFVFSLPLYTAVAHWLFVMVGVALACSFLTHVATGAIRMWPPPISATRGAHLHLLGLGAAFLLVLAWQHWLGQYQLELKGGDSFNGPGYTDVHVILPWLKVLIVVALAGAALLITAALMRSWSLPAVAVAMVLVAELVNPSILPSAVQRFIVDPQTLSRERPYIAHSLEMTRKAYGLTEIPERSLPANRAISEEDLRQNRDVLRNIQLWDTDVLQPDVDQQHSISSYYTFPNVTVDRYREGGQVHSTLVAQRELDLNRLAPSGRTWANDHMAYTHGYGVVRVPAGGLDSAGRPLIRRARVDEPRIYFGLQPPRSEPWVLVGTRRAEVERPLRGETAERDLHYDGEAGISLSSRVRRAVFALRFGDLNLALSSTLGDNSRIILHRDVRDRLHTLAPFLRWERQPEVAVVNGRVLFLSQGYTTTRSFPYAEEIELGGTKVNYVRGSVVATVDAYTGDVMMYATDPADPILRAWRQAFPGLFEEGRSMPDEVRDHLRYPRDMFEAQSQIWATHHIGDVDDFYTKADAWDRPVDLSGPVQRVGSIRFRFKGDGPLMKPYFLLARLPGETRKRFMLTTIFTPHSQENLSGYLAGRVDGEGRPFLTQLTLPRARPVLGPSQVTRQILATPAVGDQLRLLNEETTDLGARSVSAVELSEPRVVPIGDSFLYVQPIYVSAQGSGVTHIRLVTVYLNGHVGWGRTLDQALDVALRERRSVRSAGRSDDRMSTAKVR